MTTKRPNILFLTNSEHGQSNVILAVASELLILGEFNIHIASSSSLEQRAYQVRDSLGWEALGSLTFHLIDGLSMLQLFDKRRGTINLPHPPGVKGAMQGMSQAPEVLLYWSSSGYVECCEYCKDLIRTIDPAAVVVDPLFAPGIDACKVLSHKYMILSPLGLKDAVLSLQPRYAQWWKFPA